MRNAGSDTSVNYQACAWNFSSGVGLVAGNNDYVGLLSDGIFGEVVQGAALPASSNAWFIAAVNQSGGGWVLLDGANGVFLVNADLTVATTITPPAVVSRDGVVEYNGILLTAGGLVAAPNRQIERSDDNGVTWDSDPGIDCGVSNANGIYTNPAQNVIVCTPASTAVAAFSTDANPVAATWSTFPVVGLGVPCNHCAISDDGRKFVLVFANGQITTSDDQGTNSFSFPNSNNPFASTAIGTAIASVVYVSGMAGFILTSTTGNQQAFIPESDMQAIFASSFLGSGVTTTVQNVMSDGQQALWPANNNEAMMTLRNVGQLAKVNP